MRILPGVTATTIKIDPALRDALNAEARRRGVTAGSVVELLWEAWLREQRFAAIRAAMASTSSADLVSYDAHGVDFDGALADGLVDAEPRTP